MLRRRPINKPKRDVRLPISSYFAGIEQHDKCEICGDTAVEHTVIITKHSHRYVCSCGRCRDFSPVVRNGIKF